MVIIRGLKRFISPYLCLAIKQWQDAKDTANATDYTYYPIQFPNMALISIAEVSCLPDDSGWVTWIKLKDKSKFLCGVGITYSRSRSDKILKILYIGI